MITGILNLGFISAIMLLVWLVSRKQRDSVAQLAGEIVVYKSNPRKSFLIFKNPNSAYECYEQSTFVGEGKVYSKVGRTFNTYKQAVLFIEANHVI